MRLTVAQALVRFLSVQYSERDGVEQRLIAGCFGIFGHGNVAGVGQALLEQTEAMPFYHARNEQGMVHAAVGYARMRTGCRRWRARRRSGRARRTWSPARRWRRSTGCPCCCCRATCSPRARRGPCCRSSRTRSSTSAVNDTLRPVSRFWDRVERPGAARAARCCAAMRVLTDPAETGAVTLCLPQDVQAEAFEWPEELFDRRVWRVRRPLPEPDGAGARRRSCCAARASR